jgi:hypothetical protein
VTSRLSAATIVSGRKVTRLVRPLIFQVSLLAWLLVREG